VADDARIETPGRETRGGRLFTAARLKWRRRAATSIDERQCERKTTPMSGNNSRERNTHHISFKTREAIKQSPT
jgi:hypothetical protein